MNDIIYRLVAAGVAFGATKLAEKGVTLSGEAQTAVAIGVYGATHRAISWIAARFGKKV